MGIVRCKRGARMMREIERLKKGAIAIGFWMETEKTKSFGECASLDDFFAQFVCGGGGEGKGKGVEDSTTDLSSPCPNPNADTSSLLPPSQQNQAKDLSSPINAAAAANTNPLTTPPPPPLHHNPTGEELVMSVPQMPPVAPIAAADDLFAQFVYKGGEGSKGNPNSKPPPPPISVGASNSSPPPPQQSQITNNNQKLALSVLRSTQIAPIATAHESKSMDDLLAKLEGEGKGGIDWADNLSTPIPKSPPLTAAPAAAATAAAVTSCLTALSPLPAPPSLVQNWRPYPMSYVVMVDGEIKVMSRFFPPPPNAIIIYVEEDEEVEEVEVEVEVLMVPASNHTRKRKNTENKAEETPESDGDAENTKKKKKKKKKQRSVLTAAEMRKDCYRRLVNGSSAWVPPASPYKLLQEQHFSDPWRVVIICMLLNLTTGKQVKQILDDLFLLCPNAEAATMVSTEELMKLLKPLGLWRKRARSIKRFSWQYLESDWTHITQLHGVGKYAADAYAIFCVGEPEEVVPEDHKLVDYWRFVCEKHTIEHQQRSAGELAVAESSGGTVCWSQNCVIHDPLVC